MNGIEARSTTPLFLQKMLEEEIREVIMKDMLFHRPYTDELSAIKVFGQALPLPKKAGRVHDFDLDNIHEEIEYGILDCPWCLVKINTGQIAGVNADQKVSVAIGFGIYNHDPSNQGSQELLNLIQRFYERFAKTPLLAGQYTCTGEFEWGLQDEDTFPYFFGAISTEFKFQGYRRENPFYA